MKKKLDRNRTHKFIEENPAAVLSVISPEGKPFGSTVFIIPDDDLNFYFVTKKETEKYKSIQQNNSVAITTTNVQSQESLQAQGVAEEVKDFDTTRMIFKKLSHIRPNAEPNWLPPIVKLKAGDFVVMKIKLEWLRLANFGSAASNKAEDVFTNVIDD